MKPVTLYGADNKEIQPYYGRGINKNARQSNGVTYTPLQNKDWDALLPITDFTALLSTSRVLYNNNAVLKGSIDWLANRAVSNGYNPLFRGKDAEWGDKAKAWLKTFYRIGNVRGENYDFKSSLVHDSIAMSRDGTSYCLLTQTSKGYPQLQAIPSHRVSNRPGVNVVQTGRFKGRRLTNGCILSKVGRVIGYVILGETEAEDNYVDAGSMIAMEELHNHDQSRGLPLFSCCLDSFQQMQTSVEYELHAQQLMSAIALNVTNETGTNEDVSSYYNRDESTPVDPSVSYEQIQGGTINYLQAGVGRIETLTNDRPSDAWQKFHKRIINDCLMSVRLPYSVVVDSQGGNGTSSRMDIGKSEATITERQQQLDKFALKKITYALATAIERGYLPAHPEWSMWEFSHPRRLSIDLGRDNVAELKSYDAGLRTKTQILAERNISLNEQLTEQYTEKAKEILIRQEVEKKYGVTLTQDQDD